MARKANPRKFLTDDEKLRVVAAIQAAEQETSGEIRVHLESRCATEPYARAVKLFEKLGLAVTRQRNGVLIYLALRDRKFAILGDAGINDKVGPDFWDATVRKMETLFRQDRFAEGLAAGILDVGARLKEFFPYDRATDRNELPDEISSS